MIEVFNENYDIVHAPEASGEIVSDPNAPGSLRFDGDKVVVSSYVTSSLTALAHCVLDTAAVDGKLLIEDRHGKRFVLTVDNGETCAWCIREVEL